MRKSSMFSERKLSQGGLGLASGKGCLETANQGFVLHPPYSILGVKC